MCTVHRAPHGRVHPAVVVVVVSSGQSLTPACASFSMAHHAHGRSAPPCLTAGESNPRRARALYSLVAARSVRRRFPSSPHRGRMLLSLECSPAGSSSPAHGQ
ncbi:hypothetical protein VPH35_114563 [Triticum aestivum]